MGVAMVQECHWWACLSYRDVIGGCGYGTGMSFVDVVMVQGCHGWA